MDVNDIRNLMTLRANNGFFDVAIKLSDIEKLFDVVTEFKSVGYLVGLRFKKDDHLYICWGRREYFKAEWWNNLQIYLDDLLDADKVENEQMEMTFVFTKKEAALVVDALNDEVEKIERWLENGELSREFVETKKKKINDLLVKIAGEKAVFHK